MTKNKDIESALNSVKKTAEYRLITRAYGTIRAKRSGVPLMNHIDEGLVVMIRILASQEAMKAYCIHPLVQEDSLLEVFGVDLIKCCDSQSLLLAKEYREAANSYLSKGKPEDYRPSAYPDVQDMLIADKIQNKKDFELYHAHTHPRAEELKKYFQNWMVILQLSKTIQKSLTKSIS